MALIATFFAAVLTAAAPAPRAVALFPVAERDQPDRDILAAARALMLETAAQDPGLTIRQGRALQAALGKDPAEALAACKGLVCLAGLGRKAGVDEVLVARAARIGGGAVELVLLVIDVERRQVSRNMAVRLASIDDVDALMGPGIEALLGVGAAAPERSSSERAPPELALAEIDRPERSPSERRSERNPPELALAEIEPQAEDDADSADPEPGLDAEAPPPSRALGVLGIGGIVGLAAGAALLIPGVYYGIRAVDLSSPPSTTTQLQMVQRERTQHDAADLANGLVTTGLIVAALGGVVLILDRLAGGASPDAATDGGPTGAWWW